MKIYANVLEWLPTYKCPMSRSNLRYRIKDYFSVQHWYTCMGTPMIKLFTSTVLIVVTFVYCKYGDHRETFDSKHMRLELYLVRGGIQRRTTRTRSPEDQNPDDRLLTYIDEPIRVG